MNPRVWVAYTISLAAILVLIYSAPLRAADIVELNGTGLSTDEMADIRGGFMLDNGDFMALTMDYMKLQLLTDSNSLAPQNAAYINALSQQVRITDQGIEFGMNILQGGKGSDPLQGGFDSGNSFLMPLQNNQAAMADSFNGFTGVGNAIFNTGNYNTASIVNIFNIEMNFLKASEFAARPQFMDFIAH